MVHERYLAFRVAEMDRIVAMDWDHARRTAAFWRRETERVGTSEHAAKTFLREMATLQRAARRFIDACGRAHGLPKEEIDNE